MPSIYRRKQLSNKLKIRERRAQRRMLLEQAYLTENASSANAAPETFRPNDVTVWNLPSSSYNSSLPSSFRPEGSNEDNRCSQVSGTEVEPEPVEEERPLETFANDHEHTGDVTTSEITKVLWEEEINVPTIAQLTEEEEDPLALPDGVTTFGFSREGEGHCGTPSNHKESDKDSVIVVKTEPQDGETPDFGTTSDEDNAMAEEAETDTTTVNAVFPSVSKSNFSSLNDSLRCVSEKPNSVTTNVKTSTCTDKAPSNINVSGNEKKSYQLRRRRNSADLISEPAPSSSPTHICAICDKTLGSSFKLGEHYVDHGIRKEIQCQVCQRIFPTISDLRTHVNDYYFNKLIMLRVTESLSQFQCPICHVIFVTKLSLECHGTSHEVDDLVCKICVQGLPSFNALVSHTKRHKSATHQCTICNQDFKERKTAISHVLEKHKDDFETCCEFCGNKLRSVEALEIHREQFHASDIKWVNKFQTPRMLKRKVAVNRKKQSVVVQESSRPKRVNKIEKLIVRKKEVPLRERKTSVVVQESSRPKRVNRIEKLIVRKKEAPLPERKTSVTPKSFQLVSCERCGKTVQQNSMKGHQSSIKCRFPLLFRCQTCGKKFRSQQSLKAHEELHVGFQCPFCPSPQFRYVAKAGLLRHLSVSHLKPEGFVEFNIPPDAERKYVCEKCNASYTTAEALKEHTIYHGIPAFQCPDCPHKFFTNYQLFRHKVKEHGRYRVKLADGRTIMCHQCPSTFTSRSGYDRHKKVAHSETPSSVLCEVCGKSFIFRDLLSRHVRKVHGKNKKSEMTNPELSVS